ncbi:MAG: helix-turn-helix domain-containing protein [Actinomycetota bacterium]
MAGTIGVGSALRRAREIRGITIDEAARDTKLRPEQLHALEGEAFDELGDPVYARAMVRTYAQYLGLKPERVLSVYAKHTEAIEPPAPPGKLGRVERGLAASRIRDNQKFLLVAAAVVLLALIGVGLVSRGGAPQAAAIDTPAATVAATSPTPGAGIDVTIVATAPVEVSAVIDGGSQSPTTLRPGESIALMATEELQVSATDGGAIDVTVDGRDTGVAGRKGQPWSETFTPRGGGG